MGLLLLGLAAAWALLSTPEAPQAGPAGAAYVLLAVGLVAGSLLGRHDPATPGLLVLAGALVVLMLAWPQPVSGEAMTAPLGYMNSNAALVLCAAAGAVVATSGRPMAWRGAAAGIALAAAVACATQDAQAAALAAVLLAGWSVTRHLGPTVLWAAVAAVLLLVPVLLTVAWAAGVLPRPRLLVSALSEERFDLWSEAWDLLLREPVTGIGPGRFSEESPTGADPDLAWAHSYVLQTGAELGLVGLGLLALLVGWASFALGRRAALLGILLLPASVDYVLHFGGVLLALSLVVGGALSAPRVERQAHDPPP